MATPTSKTVPASEPNSSAPAGEYSPIPEYSASGRPSRWAERVAFQIWILFFLLVIAFTLLNYLANWLL